MAGQPVGEPGVGRLCCSQSAALAEPRARSWSSLVCSSVSFLQAGLVPLRCALQCSDRQASTLSKRFGCDLTWGGTWKQAVDL